MTGLQATGTKQSNVNIDTHNNKQHQVGSSLKVSCQRSLMGSRKRLRTNPKVEASPEAPQNVVAGQAAQAAVPLKTSGHADHATGNGGAASSSANSFLQETSSISIKVCFRS